MLCKTSCKASSFFPVVFVIVNQSCLVLFVPFVSLCVIMFNPSPLCIVFMHRYALLFFACNPLTTMHFSFTIYPPTLQNPLPPKGANTIYPPTLRKPLPPKGANTIYPPTLRKSPSQGRANSFLSPNTTKSTPSEGSEHYLSPNTTKTTPNWTMFQCVLSHVRLC